jgi:hypothetical protein
MLVNIIGKMRIKMEEHAACKLTVTININYLLVNIRLDPGESKNHDQRHRRASAVLLITS